MGWVWPEGKGPSMNGCIPLFLSCQRLQLNSDLISQAQWFNDKILYVYIVFSSSVSASAVLCKQKKPEECEQGSEEKLSYLR